MNHSLIDLSPACGFSPVNGSIAACTTPSGRWKSLIAHFEVASWRKPCQTYVETSIEKTACPGVETIVLSLLPFQTPTARAYSPFARPASVGGAMNPYALRSFASLFVPVFNVAGRRPLAGPFSENLPQNGLILGFVLPDRMSVTIQAACGLTACGPSGGTYGLTASAPDASLTDRIVVCPTRFPPLASVPYAVTRSTGRTSWTPSAIDSPAVVLSVWKTIPKSR